MEKKLKTTKTDIDGLYIIEPCKYIDYRGSFSRVYCENEMESIFSKTIKQINHSITKQKGTIRGLHFQYEPNCEIKMVKCIKGSVLDVVVDIRKNSPTFLRCHEEVLSAENMKMIYIPKGFAHGFQALEDDSELLYFHSNIYTPNNEGALNVKDPLLNIKWPLDILNLSKRDSEHKFLDNNFKGIVIDEL